MKKWSDILFPVGQLLCDIIMCRKKKKKPFLAIIRHRKTGGKVEIQ